MARWIDVVQSAERWMLPSECVACRQPSRGGDEALVCDVCRARWQPISEPVCARCGDHLPLRLECRTCAEWPPDFGPVRSAVRLDPAVRLLVHRFKYHGWWRLAESFALRMAPLIRHVAQADLVPIPLARRRRRVRGYNQAEQLAIALGAITGLPVRAERLRRARETVTQTRLTPEHRRANLSTAFSAMDDERPVILVDDVFTTGATLCSAATELLDRGAEGVEGVTFARAELPLTGI
jgi:ComF family protein